MAHVRQKSKTMKYELIAARLYLDMAISKDLIDWAVSMLESGFDSSSVRVLAGLSEPLDRIEVLEYFKRAKTELNIPEISREDAITFYGCDICRKILRGEISPSDGAKRIYEIFQNDDNNKDFLIWLKIDDAIGYVSSNEYPYSYPEMTRTNIDEIIRREARGFLNKHETV